MSKMLESIVKRTYTYDPNIRILKIKNLHNYIKSKQTKHMIWSIEFE